MTHPHEALAEAPNPNFAAIIRAHRLLIKVGQAKACTCGWEDGFAPNVTEAHLAHLASVLADHFAEAVTEARAAEHAVAQRHYAAFCGAEAEIARLRAEFASLAPEAPSEVAGIVYDRYESANDGSGVDGWLCLECNRVVLSRRDHDARAHRHPAPSEVQR